MAMEAVGATLEAKTDMAGAHFPPPVPVTMAPSEAEERDADNKSPGLVMMEPHSKVFDYRTNTNKSVDGVILTDATMKAPAENSGYGQGRQVGWTIFRRYTEPLPVPMIPPASSYISLKRILAYKFTQYRTPNPLILTLGPSK